MPNTNYKKLVSLVLESDEAIKALHILFDAAHSHVYPASQVESEFGRDVCRIREVLGVKNER